MRMTEDLEEGRARGSSQRRKTLVCWRNGEERSECVQSKEPGVGERDGYEE